MYTDTKRIRTSYKNGFLFFLLFFFFYRKFKFVRKKMKYEKYLNLIISSHLLQVKKKNCDYERINFSPVIFSLELIFLICEHISEYPLLRRII